MTAMGRDSRLEMSGMTAMGIDSRLRMSRITRKRDSRSPPSRLRVEALQRVNARTRLPYKECKIHARTIPFQACAGTSLTGVTNIGLAVSQTTDSLVRWVSHCTFEKHIELGNPTNLTGRHAASYLVPRQQHTGE